MDIEYVKKRMNIFKIPKSGTVSEYEVCFIDNLIKNHKPNVFLELGVASGLSTGFIIESLSAHSENSILFALDLMEKFFGDKSKNVGFLVEDMLEDIPIDYRLNVLCWVGDLEKILSNKKIDMAFIDANHQHPWPVIDTLMLFPYINKNCVLIYHDIELYKKQDVPIGIGPYYLFNGIEGQKDTIQGEYKNIGSIIINKNIRDYEENLFSILKKEWTIKNIISQCMVERISEILVRYYGKEFSNNVLDLIKERNTQ